MHEQNIAETACNEIQDFGQGAQNCLKIKRLTQVGPEPENGRVRLLLKCVERPRMRLQSTQLKQESRIWIRVPRLAIPFLIQWDLTEPTILLSEHNVLGDVRSHYVSYTFDFG